MVCPALESGGAERQLVALCRRLPWERFDIRVAYYETAGPLLRDLEQTRAGVRHIDRSGVGLLGVLRGLRREIRSWQPHVLDCRLASAYRLGRLAALGLGVPGVIAEERSSRSNPGVRLFLDRFCNLWTDVWVGNSQAVAEHIERDLGVSRRRIEVIHNGVDVARFRSRSVHPQLAELRARGRQVVLNLGRLEVSKNQRLFLEACALLARDRDGLAFAVCGKGGLRGDLEAQAARLGLGESCAFLGFQPDVPSVLAGADLLIQSSTSEGLPNAVMEAMCAGVPVVATDVGGTGELITDGVEGLLVPVGDADLLARRAGQVLADPSLAARLARAATRRVETKFSATAMAAKYQRLYERLTHCSKATRALGAEQPA